MWQIEEIVRNFVINSRVHKWRYLKFTSRESSACLDNNFTWLCARRKSPPNEEASQTTLDTVTSQSRMNDFSRKIEIIFSDGRQKSGARLAVLWPLSDDQPAGWWCWWTGEKAGNIPWLIREKNKRCSYALWRPARDNVMGAFVFTFSRSFTKREKRRARNQKLEINCRHTFFVIYF